MSKSKSLMLLIVGILFCSLSFVYKYAFDYKNPTLTAVIMTLDVALLIFNMYYLSYTITEKTGRSILNSIVSSLLYFVGITGVIMAYAEENASLQLFLGTLETLVYLSPIIMILLPIIYVFAMILE